MDRGGLIYDAPFELIPFDEPLFVSSNYKETLKRNLILHFNNRSDWDGIETRSVKKRLLEYSLVADTFLKINKNG